MRLGCHAEQNSAQQARLAQVEGTPGFAGDQPIELISSIGWVPRREFDQKNGRFGDRNDHPEGFPASRLETGAKRFVSGHEFVQGNPQRSQVKGSLEPEGAGAVVCSFPMVQLMNEPQVALVGRCGPDHGAGLALSASAVFIDHGSPFKSAPVHFIRPWSGIELMHSKVGHLAAADKVERLFKPPLGLGCVTHA